MTDAVPTVEEPTAPEPLIRCLVTTPDGFRAIVCNTFANIAATKPDDCWVEFVPDGVNPLDAPPPPDPLAMIRAERNNLINATLWAVAPSSPLTDACRAAFLAWHGQLHAWTLLYPDGTTPLPAMPEVGPGDFRPPPEQA